MNSLDLDYEAAQLISQLADGCESNGLGSATHAIYDTEWLSMVSRTVNGKYV